MSDVTPEAIGSWSFYAASATDTDIKSYLPITPVIDAARNVFVAPTFPQLTQPHMYWTAHEPAAIITIRPESDRNVAK